MHQKLQDLRNKIKSLRQQMPASERERGALLMRGRLFTWLASQRTELRNANQNDAIKIAAFWPMQFEPELQPLLRQWANDDNIRISLPVVKNADPILAWRQWDTATTMQDGPFNIQEPVGPDLSPTDIPNLVLVPTLGFNRSGDRLGYGGGFYDRCLAQWQASGQKFTTIGIAWACGDLSKEAYTAQEHDVRLDSILTDKGWAVPAPASLLV